MAVINAAKEDQNALKMKYTSTSKLETGFKTNVDLPGGHKMIVDEPPTFPGGGDAGPNPLDLMCGSFGTCQEITYKMYATVMGIELKSVRCVTEGQIDLRGLCSITNDVGFSGITGKIFIESEASEEQLKQLKTAVDAHCPLLATLRNPVPIALELEHKKNAVPDGKAADPVTPDGIGAVITAGKEDEKALKFTYGSSSKLASVGLDSEVTLSNHKIIVDEPTTMPGGNNKGPNPLDLFCASLGSCQEITYKMYATVMGIPLNSVSAEVTADIDLRGLVGLADEVVAISSMNVKVTVDSPADLEQIQQLKAAVDTHCPMVETVKCSVPVTLEMTKC
eukprot:gnl/TRDRNA2_/TRDRNA2_29281_c0_seq1.p1 gnl/TRDRNA2_/TRDRNA2_29281_c0~~gnl/TRDRNA2_/TRDRNA2_29281_c0_seq1.p1  ORF type:complete len:344 (-),score=75.31 gnl/TRDRNA2_/TRDRNA2_29281_c0_seq1:211-1218(-)